MRRKWIWIVVAVVVVAMAAGVPAGIALVRKPSPATYLAMGDSLAAGVQECRDRPRLHAQRRSLTP